MQLFTLVATYAFLTVVVLSAIVCLLALIGKVRVQKGYLKPLFSSVLLVMASVVFSAVRKGLAPDAAAPLSETILLSNGGAWDWNYPELSWRTKMHFTKGSAGLAFSGTTFLGATDVPLITWKSTQSISASDLATELSFPVTKQWTKQAAERNPDLKYAADQPVAGTMKLSSDVSLRGAWTPTSSTGADWSVMLTRSWH